MAVDECMRNCTNSLAYLLILLLFLSASCWAKYSGGTGEPNDPYLISTPEDLNAIGAEPNDWSKHFLMTADINMAGFSYSAAIIAPDTGSSSGHQGTSFSGSFDGAGHVISNLNIDGESKGSDYLGLFGQVYSVFQIQNLGMVNTSVYGDEYVGGLIGYNMMGTLKLCYMTGMVTGKCYVGGLVGVNSSYNCVLMKCYSVGTVSGVSSSFEIGGLVGLNLGRIKESYSTGSISGDDRIGGLVGRENFGILSQCYSTSTVTGKNYVGGLVGWNTNQGSILDCYSSGPISGISHVGGMVGTGACAINSYWDMQTSGQDSSASGKGRITSQMKTAANYLGWNGCGQSVWTINDGNDYPRLAWEGKPGNSIPASNLQDFVSGSGTETDPYIVFTADQFNKIGLYPCEWDKHYKLVADIDLSAYPNNEFNQIGAGRFTSFEGVFNGDGHTISNFTFSSSEMDCVGIFGVVDYYRNAGAKIENLGLKDINISEGGYHIGGLVGMNSGTVSNCNGMGFVRGTSQIGLLVGTSIVGTITQSYSVGTVSGIRYIGGLVGSNHSAVISQCYSTGSVSGSGSCVGGLAGDNFYENGTINDCYSASSVNGPDFCTGGLVGRNQEGTITHCFSTGIVSPYGSYIGGLVGCTSGTITESFWDTQTSAQTTSAGGTGKLTSQMKAQSTFTSSGWDFENVWDICEGMNYPKLIWQIPAGDFFCPNGVDFIDYSVLATEWYIEMPEHDIAPEGGDGVVDWQDLALFCENWLIE